MKKKIKLFGLEVTKTEKEKNTKTLIKEQAKLKKNTASSLEWMHIEEVCEQHIHLKKNGKEKYVKGFKIQPHNIFLDAKSEQVNRISRLRVLYNNIEFKLYHSFVFNPVNLDVNISQLTKQYESEDDPMIQGMIMDDIQKMMVFIENWRELEFFITVMDDNIDDLNKKIGQLSSELKMSRLQYSPLNQVDFNNYISHTFENDLINDYLFSTGSFEEIYQKNIEEAAHIEYYGQE